MESGKCKRWKCDYCPEKFGRREHLQRHVSSHIGVKAFRCDLCSRMFSRRDTLKRHQSIHQSGSHDEGDPLLGSRRPRAQRACGNCARLKQRCNGVWPCHRCVQKNILCPFTESSGSAGTQNTAPRPSLPVYSSGSPERYTREGDNGTIPVMVAGMYDMDERFLPTPGDDGRVPGQNMLGARSPPVNDTLTFQCEYDEVSLGILDGITAEDSFMPVTVNVDSSSTNGDNATGPQSSNSGECSCPWFPRLSDEDHDIVAAEAFGHVAGISEAKYRFIFNFWKGHQCARCGASQSRSSFISHAALDSMVQSYFEHYDPWMPFLHPSVFEDDTVSWIVALAVASVGCQHSGLRHSDIYLHGLCTLLQKALPFDAAEASSFDQTALAQSLLLRDVGLIFSGYQDDILTSQYQRNMLVTLTRSIALKDDEIWRIPPNLPPSEILGRWSRWVISETQRRTMYCVWVLECCHCLFRDMPPSLSLDDFRIALPSSDGLWESSPHAWYKKVLEDEYVYETCSLKTVFTDPQYINRLADNTSRLRDFVILVTFYIEERRVFGSPRPWFAAERPGDVGGQTFFEWPDNLIALRTPTDRLSDRISQPFGCMRTLWCFSKHTKVLYYLIQIVRRTPLRCLYALSGWQATPEQIGTATIVLSQWMKQHTTSARENLLHAASLYNCLYDEPNGTGFCHISFLIATLYIWAYLNLNPEVGDSLGSEAQRKLCRPLRVDRRPSFDEKQNWILGLSNSPIFLRGVGMLVGEESTLRVLKTFRRVLSSESSWRSLRHGLIYAVTEMIDGRFASYAPMMRQGERRQLTLKDILS